jgi:N-acetylneuraminic acid mutarotase/dihydrodipicolinate synthase/N-acetylneuraminate lyase
MINNNQRRGNKPAWKFIATIFILIALLSMPVWGLKAQNSSIPQKHLLSPLEFKARLKGPILSFPTPFTESYEINYQGVEQMIKPALAYGCGVVALTSGNSKYDRLSYEEVRELTRFVVATVGDKAVTIASAGPWDRKTIIDYVRYAEFVGASAVQVSLPNDLTKDSPVADIVKFYKDVDANTSLGIILHGYYSVELLTELVKINSIVAMKEDVDYPYYINRQIMFGDKLAIFGGGNDGRYLHGYPYGSPAYYSTLYTYAPEMGLKFWKAIQNKDMKLAAQILLKYDFPFIEQFTPALWQAAIEYAGGPQRFIRPQSETLPESKLKDMRKLFSNMGLSPALKYNTKVTQGTSLPEKLARGGHVAGMVDGNVIVAGGNNWSKDKTTKYWLNDALVFSNNKWISGPELPKPVAYAMYASDATGLYYAGGTEDGKSTSSEAYRLTSIKEGWKPLPKLPVGINSGAGAILNDKFYVASGTTASGNTNKMFVLDLKNTNKGWKECESVPGEKRIFPSLVANGKYLYLLGGVAEAPLNDSYRYDPDKDKWTQLSNLPLKGYAWVGQSIDDDHLLITGRADDSKPFSIHKDIWVIDLKDMSMRKAGELAGPTTTATLTKVKNNEWWLIGGEPDSKLNRSEEVSIISVN